MAANVTDTDDTSWWSLSGGVLTLDNSNADSSSSTNIYTAVIGAGDLPEYTLKESPAISTVAWPLERMGREAVRRAIAQRNRSRSTPVNIILDTTLVCRDTTPGD